jgi:hypothetical protein
MRAIRYQRRGFAPQRHLASGCRFGWLDAAPLTRERDRLGAILYKLQRS